MTPAVHSFKSPGANATSPPSLLELAQTALRVELYTISLYLFALYSLEDQTGNAGKKILGKPCCIVQLGLGSRCYSNCRRRNETHGVRRKHHLLPWSETSVLQSNPHPSGRNV
jgi:hypothetical protein